jgi:hypothetical protein
MDRSTRFEMRETQGSILETLEYGHHNPVAAIAKSAKVGKATEISDRLIRFNDPTKVVLEDKIEVMSLQLSRKLPTVSLGE